MNKIRGFLDSLFELSIRFCGEEVTEKIQEILRRAEQFELDLVLKTQKYDQNSLLSSEFIRTQFYSDTILSFCKNNLLKKDLYYNYLYEFGSTCLDFGEISLAEFAYTEIIKEIENEKKYQLLLANSLLKRAEVYIRSTRWKNANTDINKAKKIFALKNDKKGLARLFNLQGIIKSEKGQINAALKNFETALNVFTKVKDNLWVGLLEMNIGNLITIQGNWDDAYVHYKRALAAFEKLMELKYICLVRYNLGVLFKNRGELEAALTEFDRALELAIEAGYLLSKGLAYLGKSDVYAKLEDYALALEFSFKAMEVFYKIMDKVGLADTYKIKGIIQRDTSNYEIAETYLLTSLRLSEEIESILNYAEAAYELGILYRKWGKKDLAVKYLRISEKYFAQVGAKENLERVQLIMDKT